MKRSTIILVLAVILALLASFCGGSIIGYRNAKRALNRPDTVYIDKWLPQPVEEPKDSTKQKPKVVYLPRVELDTVPVHDTTYIVERIVDSVLVEVPIVEKTFSGENYRATVRGYNPELISMWVKEREMIVKTPKRWTFTVGPQAGVGITTKGLQPYLGFGGTFGYSFQINRDSR